MVTGVEGERSLAAQPRPKSGLGLCLSGGGFRASLFHMGVLRYLAEAGQLVDVRAVSTVSGGSIFGAFVAARWEQLGQQGYTLEAYDAIIKKPFSDIVTGYNLRNRWIVGSILRLPRLVMPNYSRGNVLVEVFDEWLYGGKKMTDLPEGLDLVINATSLATGRQFRFRRQTMGEWEFGDAPYGDHPVLLAYAVVASSAGPFIVPPVCINPRLYQWSKQAPKGNLWLADGGVYDNLGSEWFLGEQDTADALIVSEASGTLRIEWTGYLMHGIARRAQSIQYEQSRAVRQRWLRDQMFLQRRLASLVKDGQLEASVAAKLEAFTRKGIIVSIDRAIADLEWIRELMPHALPPRLVEKVAGVRTDLDCFLPEEAELLAYHGYWLTHAYLSTFYREQAVQDPSWKLDLSATQTARYEAVLADSRKSLSSHRKWW